MGQQYPIVTHGRVLRLPAVKSKFIQNILFLSSFNLWSAAQQKLMPTNQPKCVFMKAVDFSQELKNEKNERYATAVHAASKPLSASRHISHSRTHFFSNLNQSTLPKSDCLKLFTTAARTASKSGSKIRLKIL